MTAEENSTVYLCSRSVVNFILIFISVVFMILQKKPYKIESEISVI